MMKLKKDYWIAIVCKAVVILTELLITIFINRGLGVTSKGEYSYVMKVVEVAYIFCGLGLGQAYATFRKKGEEKLRDTFVFLGFLQSFLVLICGLIIVDIFPIDYGATIVMLTALSVLKSIFSMIAVIEKNILRNIIQVFINIVYVVALAGLFFTGICSLSSVLTCYGVAEIIRIIVLCLLYRLKPSVKHLNKSTFQVIYKIGFTTMILMVLITLNYSIDTVMIRNMSSSYSTGIYSVGVNFASMFLMIPDAFKDVLFGDASKKSFDSHTAYSAIKVSVVISILGIVGWLVLGKFAINLLYGEAYLNSYQVTTILFLGCISLSFFKILQPVFIADGNQTIACIYLGISVLCNIVANYFLIPSMDYIGAAIASVISYSVCGGLFLFRYQRKNCGGGNNIYDDLFRLKGKRSRKAMMKQLLLDQSFRAIYYLRKGQNSRLSIEKKYLELKYRKYRDKYGIEIPFSVKIGTGILMIHPYNITINRDAVIGNNFTILKGATVGNSKTGKVGAPVIGDDCYVGINSTIVGNVTIGDRVMIAPNTFVNFNVPDDSIVIGAPGVIHRKKDASLPYITNRIVIDK